MLYTSLTLPIKTSQSSIPAFTFPSCYGHGSLYSAGPPPPPPPLFPLIRRRRRIPRRPLALLHIAVQLRRLYNRHRQPASPGSRRRPRPLLLPSVRRDLLRPPDRPLLRRPPHRRLHRGAIGASVTDAVPGEASQQRFPVGGQLRGRRGDGAGLPFPGGEGDLQHAHQSVFAGGDRSIQGIAGHHLFISLWSIMEAGTSAQ
ncbi:unnamed protein product [Linum tenue]|uniref:Uncharacterized protein n=1 Tax=Linum tenue TaxID=586396 RepID=A0AAV0RKW0_9ROSI|nr:unnamed protein product [Linum tenue]